VRKRKPRIIRVRDPLVVAAQNRLEARKRAGVVSDQTLSSTMIDYIQSVRGKSGDLNVEKLKKNGTHRGAPIGNSNRVTHGKRRGDIKRLCADIRAHVHGGRDLVSRLISQGGGGSMASFAALPRHMTKVSRHRFKRRLSTLPDVIPGEHHASGAREADPGV
jgi:hypothetical protein